MSADRQPLPRTGQDIIPSYYNSAADRHEPVQGQDGAAHQNLARIGGVVQTGADWTPYVQRLDQALSAQAPREMINTQALADSTTQPLAAGDAYTGAAFPVAGWGRIVGSVYSDQAGTLYIEQSPDGVNWDVVVSINYAAGTTPGFSVEVLAPEARLRYVNGATAQTVFRLYAYRRRV